MTKTITFAIMHFSVAFTVAYLITGSFVVGGAVALIEPAINTVAYYFHEKIWNRLRRDNTLQNTFVSAGESFALKS
ncbi:DUF2061 domain-containing protein [Rhodanobacter aciditrophus]|uniref:DUF2061 domain-containing protein n=1 Tax=Rhodanobacter aciditrophus TaxID=1623218 RepID=A0ABW4AY12_9GAMM